jgi:3-oxoacyl-[acyl-carrier-protein] synthase-3
LANRKNRTPLQAHIIGWGMAVPKRTLSNGDLEAIVDTSDQWIRQRTGIIERHIASEEETTFTLGLQAVHAALEGTDLDPVHLNLIIYQMPSL